MTERFKWVLWQEAEPGLLDRDLKEVPRFASGLSYVAPEVDDCGEVLHHGKWVGTVPVWPFERGAPANIDQLVPEGVEIELVYSAAHPMVPPRIYVTDPEPLLQERGPNTWHVAPGGSLCLLQTDGGWTPESPITDLIAKAAGWRIEYALMKAGAIEQMTLCGIVSDPLLDAVITEVANR